MNKYIAILASALAFAGCAVSEIDNGLTESSAEKIVFTAGFEQEDEAVRTFIDNDLKMKWTADDRITIFMGSNYNDEYAFEGQTGDDNGPFAKVRDSFFVGVKQPAIYAVYPYSSSTSLGENGVLNVTLPSVQAYAENSFGVNANTMVAQISDLNGRNLSFKNVCGYVRLSLYGEASIKTVTLTANKGEKIAGPAAVTSYSNDAPTVVMGEDAGSTIVIDCGAGVRVGSTPETATQFFFVVPPTTFEEGFTVRVESTSGGVVEKSAVNAVKVERNTITRMLPFEVEGTPGLTSLEMVPQVYTDGIGAVLYKYASGDPVDFITDGGWYYDQLGNECYVCDDRINLTEKAAIVTASNDNGEVGYSLSRINKLQCKVNPAEYVLDPVENWSLESMLKQHGTRAPRSGWDAWTPVLLDIEKDADEPGVANVTYMIENSDVLGDIVNGEGTAGDLYFPAVALTCETKDGMVRSDYEAVVPSREYFTAITFNRTTLDEEHRPHCPVEPALKPHLYQSAGDAIRNCPSLEIEYYSAPVDLKSMMTTHVYSEATGQEYEMTLADIEKCYPELRVRFSSVTYIAGINSTEQNQYCILDGEAGVFQPAYPKYENGRWAVYPCEAGNTNVGMSAVGRQPIVLVTLEHDVFVKGRPQVETIVAGYFKIILTSGSAISNPAHSYAFTFTPFPTVPYTCEYDALSTTWKEFSWGVLENDMHTSYDQFLETIKIQEGTYMVRDRYDFQSVSPENKYGIFTYVQDDRKMSSVNDIFTWQLSYEQATEIYKLPGHTVTLYKKFMDMKNYQALYIGCTVTIADPARIDFGANKIMNEWFYDVNNEYKNTARVNVLVPNADEKVPVIGGDVTEFSRNLNYYYVGYHPAIALARESEALYKDYVKAEDLTFEYAFSSNQPKVGGVQFLAVEAAGGKGTAIVNKANKRDTIATLTPEGVITYKWEEGNTTAKKLLNLWGHSAEETAKGILYANVDVCTYYGRCEIPANATSSHVRFVRPVDVKFADMNMPKGGVADGENVGIVDLIEGITDWNWTPVVVKNDAGGLEPHVARRVDMYAYYQFKNLTINLEKAEINNWDASDAARRGLLKAVRPEAHLALGTLGSDKVFNLVSESVSFIDITNLDVLGKYAINYRDGSVSSSGFDIFIPVEFEYAWGVYTGELKVSVK